jgi:hypothetical protein
LLSVNSKIAVQSALSLLPPLPTNNTINKRNQSIMPRACTWHHLSDAARQPSSETVRVPTFRWHRQQYSAGFTCIPPNIPNLSFQHMNWVYI